jgi:AcrR family transcriptional regulator
MPMLIDTESRVDTLVRAVNDVLIEHGPAGLSLRRIAAFSGVSTSSMLHHLGSREHLLRVAAGWTARERLRHFRAESRLDGILAFLPRNGDELLDTRAWLAWLELWRSEDFLTRWIVESREEELELLTALTGQQLLPTEPDGLLALIDGLRVAVCAPVRPLRLDAARDILRSWPPHPPKAWVAVAPPSMASSAPVTKLDSSLAR